MSLDIGSRAGRTGEEEEGEGRKRGEIEDGRDRPTIWGGGRNKWEWLTAKSGLRDEREKRKYIGGGGGKWVSGLGKEMSDTPSFAASLFLQRGSLLARFYFQFGEIFLLVSPLICNFLLARKIIRIRNAPTFQQTTPTLFFAGVQVKMMLECYTKKK